MYKHIKKANVFLLVIVMVALVIVGCNKQEVLDPESEAEFPKMVINVGHGNSETHSYQKGLLEFQRVVEEKTGGNVTIEIHPCSSLGSEREMVEGLQLGTLEMCLAATSPLTAFVPEFSVFDLPFIFTSRDQAWNTLDGELGSEMLDLLESKNLKGLAYFEVGFRNFTNNKHPINTPSDLSGLKIRTMETPVHVAAVGYWGGNAISMPIGEVYTSLQMGTIDGQENPYASIIGQKLYEVQPYISISEHFYTATPLLISKQLWDSLSPELQAVLEEAAYAGRDACREANLKVEEEGAAICEEAGCKINYADKEAFKETAPAIYEMFADQIGQEYIDKFIAEQD
jgi:tripartite ATP-independent transporter DctP family solute receptor